MKHYTLRLAALAVLIVLGLVARPHVGHAATEKAIVAGGCFWCVEADFESVPGVKSVVSGYTGGTLENPTYTNHRGHIEAVEITFDNARVSYDMILFLFFRSINPTDTGGQFCDRGDSYTTAIFPLNAEQARVAELAKKQAAQALGRKIVTPIRPAGTFWKAEGYHQDYYKGKNIVLTRFGPRQQSEAYKLYRKACGRDKRVRELWGKDAVFAH